MKGKVIRGSSFAGVLNYVLDDSKEARIIGGNMVGQDAASLAKEFAHVRHLRPDCGRPVLHIPLRLPEGEDVSDVRWLEMAIFFLKLMKLPPNRPWLIVKHVKNHIHLITSRVDNRGTVWTGKWEGLRCIQATQEIERHFGLTITPGLEGRDKKQVRLTSGQLRKMQREIDRGETPAVPAKVQIAERIQTAIDQCNGTFIDFKTGLEKLNVKLTPNLAKSTQHVSGISFTFDGVTMKGSKVARAYSWQGITQLLADRKTAYENPGVAQPNIQSGPKPDDRRPDQSKPARTCARPRPAGNRTAKGIMPTPPRIPPAMGGNGNGTAGAGADLLLALLAKPPVATGLVAIAGPVCPATAAIIAVPGKAGVAPGRDPKNPAADDDQVAKPDGPAMS